MSLEEDILIERFLKNELSKTEKNKVLERMNSDVSFKEKVLFEQQLFEALDETNWSFAKNIDITEVKEYESIFKSDEVKEIKKSIAKANNNFKKKKTFTIKKWYTFSSVAVIALLISVYFLMPKNTSTQELYASHMIFSDLPSIVNRGNQSNYKNLVKAQNFFEKKQFSKSANILVKELNRNLNNSNLYLYLAVSQIEINEFEKAEKTLDALLNTNLVDAQKSYWYKSLLYLKSNQIEKAKETLTLIIENNYFNHKKAKKILEALSKL